MKITYVAHSHIPSTTANSIHVMKMCQAFAQEAADVALCVPGQKSDVEAIDIFDFYGVPNGLFPIVKLPYSQMPGNTVSFALRAVLRAKHEKSRVVYSRVEQPIMLTMLLNIPFVLELHNQPQHRIFLGMLPFWARSKKCIAIVVISRALKKHLINLGVQEKKIIVLPDAVDIESFPLHKSLTGKNLSKIRVGYTGHLYKGRGINIILEMALKLVDIDFEFIGGNPEDIAFWEQKAKEKKIKNVTFSGFVPYRDIPSKLSQFDILVMPYQKNVATHGNGSNTANFMSPMKMFEYMATGKAIVASDLPVLREILFDNWNCLLVPPDDIQKWICAVKALADNPNLRARLGLQARKDVENNFTWRKRANTILAVLQKYFKLI